MVVVESSDSHPPVRKEEIQAVISLENKIRSYADTH